MIGREGKKGSGDACSFLHVLTLVTTMARSKQSRRKAANMEAGEVKTVRVKAPKIDKKSKAAKMACTLCQEDTYRSNQCCNEFQCITCWKSYTDAGHYDRNFNELIPCNLCQTYVSWSARLRKY
jgi:hypothetical protein